MHADPADGKQESGLGVGGDWGGGTLSWLTFASEARVILYGCSCLQLLIAELFETEGLGNQRPNFCVWKAGPKLLGSALWASLVPGSAGSTRTLLTPAPFLDSSG